jgi:hypothetical protein
MKTWQIATLTLIAGAALGITATEGFNLYRQSHNKQINNQIFQDRLHCKSVADAYVKEQSKDRIIVSLLPGKVDYSPARNSCVAGVETGIISTSPMITDSIEDLLSGETLFSVKGEYPVGYNQPAPIDLAFDYVLKNASKPTELQKSSDDIASKMRSQVTSPSGASHGPWEQYQAQKSAPIKGRGTKPLPAASR